jgi:hypothetical protein
MNQSINETQREINYFYNETCHYKKNQEKIGKPLIALKQLSKNERFLKG